MAVARFYHLTREPPEALLPVLIGKALEQGLRVAVRGREPAAMEALDTALWRREGSCRTAWRAGRTTPSSRCCWWRMRRRRRTCRTGRAA
jgi:hypothetical protein